MRVRKNNSFLLLMMLLTSCSLFLPKEEKIRQLAVDTALAYFTFDYEDQAGWMAPVQDEYYYQQFIENRVLPIVGPYLAQSFVKSTAELVSIEETARGIGEDNTEVIVWEINVQVSPNWPASGAPEMPRANREELPWTNGEITTVYAAAANRLGVWNIRLISPESAEKVILSLTSPS